MNEFKNRIGKHLRLMLKLGTTLLCINDLHKKKKDVQSDLGYPATSGPAHIRISDLAGYERCA